MIGHIKFFNPAARYGFIIPDGTLGKDKTQNVFFHESAFREGIRGVVDGAEVEYELIPHLKDKKALSARLTGRAYAPVTELRKNELRKGAAYGTD